MKHTHSRKKMLLSSVAMLLVALVALGSATFAWFTSNPNADATGVKMKTTAASGLVIKTETDNDSWGHNKKLRKTDDGSGYFDLTPVSQDQSTGKFWTVNAASSNAYGHSTLSTDAMTEAPDTDTAFYSEKVYFRLSDGADASASQGLGVYLKGVTITSATGATMDGAIRVAIADASGAILGTYALNTADANGTLTTASKTLNTTWAPTTASTSLDVYTNQKSLAATGDPTDKFVTVYCYLDGQDTNCFSDEVGTANAAKIIESVKVDFTLKAAPASP